MTNYTNTLAAAAARFEGAAFAALRMVAGGMFAMHGMQKLFGWFGAASQPAVGSQIWVGGVIELVAGTLVALGLVTRPAALLASGTMAVAYFQFHWKFDFANWHWLPIVNKGEPAVLYCFVFLFIAAHGAGRASLEALIRRRT